MQRKRLLIAASYCSQIREAAVGSGCDAPSDARRL